MKKLISLIMTLAMAAGLATSSMAATYTVDGVHNVPGRQVYPNMGDHMQSEDKRADELPPAHMDQRSQAPAERPYPYHGYPQAGNSQPGSHPIYKIDNHNYSSLYHGGWSSRGQGYARVRYNNHWGFFLLLAGVNTFIYEDTIGQCYYYDNYHHYSPWCDPRYGNACVCP